MREVLIDFGIILILVMVNSVFAMTEIAVVSARKRRARRRRRCARHGGAKTGRVRTRA